MAVMVRFPVNIKRLSLTGQSQQCQESISCMLKVLWNLRIVSVNSILISRFCNQSMGKRGTKYSALSCTILSPRVSKLVREIHASLSLSLMPSLKSKQNRCSNCLIELRLKRRSRGLNSSKMHVCYIRLKTKMVRLRTLRLQMQYCTSFLSDGKCYSL